MVFCSIPVSTAMWESEESFFLSCELLHQKIFLLTFTAFSII